MSAPALLAQRLAAQGLSGAPERSAAAVVERLLAVQAQDPRGFRLAVRARSRGVTAADLERALGDERTLLVTWLNRGTLQLVRSEDYRWLQALTTPPLFTGNARRLAQEGVSPEQAERGVGVIVGAVAGDGPQTRAELAERLRASGVPTEGQALVHLLALASLRGAIVRGPVIGGQHAYVNVHDWLGPDPPPIERERALAELARRYLRGHGPAGERDLARWAGLPLRDARAGLRAIADELRERPDGLLELRRRGSGSVARLPGPRLLGPYEPVLLGWCSRDFLAGAHDVVLVRNGLFRPFALVGGRAVATWRMPRGQVELEPLEPVPEDDLRALAEDAEALRRFLEA